MRPLRQLKLAYSYGDMSKAGWRRRSLPSINGPSGGMSIWLGSVFRSFCTKTFLAKSVLLKCLDRRSPARRWQGYVTE